MLEIIGTGLDHTYFFSFMSGIRTGKFKVLLLGFGGVCAVVPTVAQQYKTLVYTRVDEPPVFPYGQTAAEYIANRLAYPASTRKAGRQGKAILRFVVDIDGRVRDVEGLQCPDVESCVAVRLILEKMPRWEPGRVRGQAVRTAVVIPVMFSLH